MIGTGFRYALVLLGLMGHSLALAAPSDPTRTPRQLIEDMPPGDVRVMAENMVRTISQELIYPKNEHVATYYAREESSSFIDLSYSMIPSEGGDGQYTYAKALRLADPGIAATVAAWLRHRQDQVTGEGPSRRLKETLAILEAKDILKSPTVENDWPPSVLQLAAAVGRRQKWASPEARTLVSGLTQKEFETAKSLAAKEQLVSAAGDLGDEALIPQVMSVMPKERGPKVYRQRNVLKEEIRPFDLCVSALANMHRKEADEKLMALAKEPGDKKYEIYTALLRFPDRSEALDRWLGENIFDERLALKDQKFPPGPREDFSDTLDQMLWYRTEQLRQRWGGLEAMKRFGDDPKYGPVIAVKWSDWDSDEAIKKVAGAFFHSDSRWNIRETVYERLKEEDPRLEDALRYGGDEKEGARVRVAFNELFRKSPKGVAAAIKQRLTDLQSVPAEKTEADPDVLDQVILGFYTKNDPATNTMIHQRLLAMLARIPVDEAKGYVPFAGKSCRLLGARLMHNRFPDTKKEVLTRLGNVATSPDYAAKNELTLSCLVEASGDSADPEIHAALLKLMSQPEATEKLRQKAALAVEKSGARFKAQELGPLFWNPLVPRTELADLYEKATGAKPTQEDWLGILVTSDETPAIREALLNLVPNLDQGTIEMPSLKSREKTVSVRDEIRRLTSDRADDLKTPKNTSRVPVETENDRYFEEKLQELADAKTLTKGQVSKGYDVVLAAGLMSSPSQLVKLLNLLADDSHPEKRPLRLAAAQAIGAALAVRQPLSGTEKDIQQKVQEKAAIHAERLRDDLLKEVDDQNGPSRWVAAARAVIQIKHPGATGTEVCGATFPSLMVMHDEISRRNVALKSKIQTLAKNASGSARESLRSMELIQSYDPKGVDREKILGPWFPFMRFQSAMNVQDWPHSLLLSETREDYIRNHSMVDNPFFPRTGKGVILGPLATDERGKVMSRGIFTKDEIEGELQTSFVKPYINFFKKMNADLQKRMEQDFGKIDPTKGEQAHILKRAAEEELALNEELIKDLEKACQAIEQKLGQNQIQLGNPPQSETPNLNPNDAPKLLEPAKKDCP